MPKIEVAGTIDRKFNQERKILSVDGISTPITAEAHGSMSQPKVELKLAGTLNEDGHFDSDQRVYSERGGDPQ